MARSLPRCFESLPPDDGKRNVPESPKTTTLKGKRELLLYDCAARGCVKRRREETNACADSFPGDFASEREKQNTSGRKREREAALVTL